MPDGVNGSACVPKVRPVNRGQPMDGVLACEPVRQRAVMRDESWHAGRLSGQTCGGRSFCKPLAGRSACEIHEFPGKSGCMPKQPSLGSRARGVGRHHMSTWLTARGYLAPWMRATRAEMCVARAPFLARKLHTSPFCAAWVRLAVPRRARACAYSSQALRRSATSTPCTRSRSASATCSLGLCAISSSPGPYERQLSLWQSPATTAPSV